MKVHYGFASYGMYGVCGSYTGERRTAIRLVNCEYCLNRIDELMASVLRFSNDWARERVPPSAPTTEGGTE